MGLLERFLRRHREEPAEDAPGLFTARSARLPPTLERPHAAATDETAEGPSDGPREPGLTAPEPEVVAARPDTVEAPPPWDEPGPADAAWDEPAPAVAPPADPDAWDDALWDEAPPSPPVVEPVPGHDDAPLFGGYQTPLPDDEDGVGAVAEPAAERGPAPEPSPEPPLFERPPPPAPVDRDIEAVDEEGRHVRVHDGRLDNRPGPIRMTPSEAVRLAAEGPKALRRGRRTSES